MTHDLSPLLAQQPGFDRLCAAVAATPSANQIVQTMIENRAAASDFAAIASAAMEARYFRCAYPDSFYQVKGNQVTYFAPQVPQGSSDVDSTLADLERCAKMRPATDGEILHDEMLKVAGCLREAVEKHKALTDSEALIQASRFQARPTALLSLPHFAGRGER